MWFYSIIGCCLFSLIDCIANRKVKGMNYITDRSRCDACGHSLEWFDLIPIISFILLKGKCRYCGKKIDYELLIMELLGLFLGTVCYLRRDLITLLIIGNIALIALIDSKSMNVYYDTLLLLALLVGIGCKEDLDLINRGLGALIVTVPMGMMILYKRDSFGLGDLYYIVIMGFYLRYHILLVTMGGCLIGLFTILFTRKKYIPFLPSLAITSIVFLIV